MVLVLMVCRDLVGSDARNLKLSSNTFFDHLILVQKTIDKFSLEKYSC
jgi:hypothetical protein